MKNEFPNSLPPYILIIFAISVAFLIGNCIYLYGSASVVPADLFFSESKNAFLSSMIGNAVVLLVLCFFYRLIKRSTDKNLLAEYALARVNEKLESAVSQHNAQLTKLSHHLIARSEEEKARLAHDLHSELGACFSVIAMDISVVSAKLENAEPLLVTRLQRVMTTIEEAIILQRQIVKNLRPSMLDSLGLPFSLAEHAEEFSAVTGLTISTDIGEDLDQIDSACALALFRIAQEAMSNTAKHAQAVHLWITLQRKEEGVRLHIVDDGIGIAPDTLFKAEACGLAAMRERARMLGGTLVVHPGAEGHGTEIEAYIPLKPVSDLA